MINQRDKNYNFPDFKDSTILEAPSKIICPQYHQNRGMKKIDNFPQLKNSIIHEAPSKIICSQSGSWDESLGAMSYDLINHDVSALYSPVLSY